MSVLPVDYFNEIVPLKEATIDSVETIITVTEPNKGCPDNIIFTFPDGSQERYSRTNALPLPLKRLVHTHRYYQEFEDGDANKAIALENIKGIVIQYLEALGIKIIRDGENVDGWLVV